MLPRFKVVVLSLAATEFNRKPCNCFQDETSAQTPSPNYNFVQAQINSFHLKHELRICYDIILYLCTVFALPSGDSDLIREKFDAHELSRSDSYFIIFKYKLYFVAATI